MELLRQIDHYLRRNGVSPSSFGRAVLHDPRFVHDLRRGRQPQTRTAARVRAFLNACEAER